MTEPAELSDPDSDDYTVFSGFLIQDTGFGFGRWKSRFCCTVGSKFHVYDDPSKKLLLYQMPLGQCTINRISAASGGREFLFSIVWSDNVSKRKLVFQAGSQVILDECLDTICAFKGKSEKLNRNAIKERYLTKLGDGIGIFKVWGTRYVIVTPDRLEYYKQKTDGIPEGILELSNASVDTGSILSYNRPNGFVIFCGSAPFAFEAKSYEDREDLMASLRSCFDTCKRKISIAAADSGNEPVDVVNSSSGVQSDSVKNPILLSPRSDGDVNL